MLEENEDAWEIVTERDECADILYETSAGGLIEFVPHPAVLIKDITS